jgi:hypothetical protein
MICSPELGSFSPPLRVRLTAAPGSVDPFAEARDPAVFERDTLNARRQGHRSHAIRAVSALGDLDAAIGREHKARRIDRFGREHERAGHVFGRLG